MAERMSVKLKVELDELVKIGNELTVMSQSSDSSLDDTQIIRASMWVGRIGQIIRSLYGDKNSYLYRYEEILKTPQFYKMHSNNYIHIGVMTGIIAAVQHEFNKGLLVDIRRLIQADIFADFLEMGEYLLNENYKDAAAVIIGGVLENSLRKLATAHGISIVNSSGKMLTLEPLNGECAKMNIYDKLVQKQITSWGDLRNKAAHGHYAEYDESQVRLMLLFVQQFCSSYLVQIL